MKCKSKLQGEAASQVSTVTVYLQGSVLFYAVLTVQL